jgi:hypothetical protein
VVERVDERRVRLVRLLKGDDESTETPRANRDEAGGGDKIR